jgi:NADH:ubiquinone oxidoreductase subunit 4 (subunit M)
MYQRTAFGVPKGEFEHAHIHDVHVPEWLAWAPMLILIVVLGVYPHALFKPINDPAAQVTSSSYITSSSPSAPVSAQPAQGR